MTIKRADKYWNLATTGGNPYALLGSHTSKASPKKCTPLHCTTEFNRYFFEWLLLPCRTVKSNVCIFHGSLGPLEDCCIFVPPNWFWCYQTGSLCFMDYESTWNGLPPGHTIFIDIFTFHTRCFKIETKNICKVSTHPWYLKTNVRYVNMNIQ